MNASFKLPKNIKIDWGTKHHDLSYIEEPFKNDQLIDEWKAADLDLSKLNPGLHQLKQPYNWMKCVTDTIEQLPIKDPAYCIHQFKPGSWLPTHSDLYGYYKRNNNVNNISDIIRIIVFLDDAVPGQILIVDDKVYNDYKKGDVAHWYGTTPHLAANLSTSNRYTLQITGHLSN